MNAFPLTYVVTNDSATMTVTDIEEYSWVRVRDKDTFSRRVTGRPSDEGARSATNGQGQNIISHEETRIIIYFN